MYMFVYCTLSVLLIFDLMYDFKHAHIENIRTMTNLLNSNRCCPDDLCYHLVFFITFEELKLPISWPMEHAGVTKLYKPFPTLCLYVDLAACIVGRVLLISLFLAGNSTPTIPHKYSQHKRSGFPVGSCDIAAADGWCGSNPEQCVRGEPLAVAVWAWQPTPGWSVS